MQGSKIVYRLLTPAYVGKTVDCIASSFTNDPFSTVSGLQPGDWAAMSGMFVERSATKDLSFIAVDMESDTVAGVILNEDWKEKKPEYYTKLSQKWGPIRAIFDKLHIAYKGKHTRYIHPNEILHPLYFSCIRPEYRRQGLVGNLLQNTLQVASDYHFDSLICEASDKTTSEVCGKLGFEKAAQVEYRTFLYKGETTFYPVPSINGDYQSLAILERSVKPDLLI